VNQPSQNASKKSLGVFAVAMFAVAGIFSLRSLPTMAEYGFSSVFYYVLAAIVFFIPSALVCAELATGWPKDGGVYIWVKEALGAKFGFLSIWFEWTNTIVWFPAVLSFVAATVAYSFMPSLAHNKYYMFFTMLALFWGATIINLFGVRVSGFISSFSIIFGTLLPGLVIISLGIIWLMSGQPSQIQFSFKTLMPHLHLGQTAFLAGLVISFAGMQVAAFHAQSVENPQKNFPRAILIATVIILFTAILSALSIAVVLPQSQISLVSGLMQTATLFFATFHIAGAAKVFAFLTALGSIAAMNTWLIGPSKGILVTAETGHLPNHLMKKNRYGVPVNVFIWQAVVGSLLATVYLFMPTISSSYWMLNVLTSQLTMFMYILLFISAIRLRYTHPNISRGYKIPGGKIGVWLVAGMGLLVSVLTLGLGFIPPSQINIGNPWFFEGFLITGILVFSIPAFWLYNNTK
tara:strand:+ start:243 stop:1631 length:1389 start_codon:yes stop_codon:yes gene_type:complete